jgi:thiol:disulfide interchange protein/DsbC/DsbD-like thiol-disulfide interchange protein
MHARAVDRGWRRPPFAFLTLMFLLTLPLTLFAAQNTTVSLIADQRTIAPGTQFTVGIRFAMRPGWHIYWANPGESGIPTQVVWHLPGGFTAGPLQWPVPFKHIEAGDVLTFGYEHDVVLLVRITAPSSLAAGTNVRLAADVSWLECATMCVPGDATIDLPLEVGSSPREGSNAGVVRAWQERLPRMTTDAEQRSLSVLFDAATLLLTLPGGEGSSDFYPLPSGPVTAGRTTVTAGKDGVTFTIPLSVSSPSDSALALRGIIVSGTGDRRLGREVAVTIPAEVARRLSGGGGTTPGGSILDKSFAPVGSAVGQGPLLLYVVFALLGGLLLNIMPCVLPVIALKVFGLVKMAGDRPGRVKRLGWSFSAGIIASFAVLALVVVLLQLAGQQVGWGFQFQEPLFVIAMAAVVFAFGLSLFGVFEIRVPGSAVNTISSSVSKRPAEGGYLASFSEGVFATILATPCTAPFLGTALGFAFTQHWWAIILMFLVVGLGMSLPYLLLTARPAWQRFLPKPGEWMETAKQFMGFLMMATLLWLLYVLGKQLGMEAVIWTGAFLLSIGVAVWLVGRYATLTASATRGRMTWLAALIIIALGYYVFLESALNVRSVIAGVPASGGTVAGETEGIAWKPYGREALEEALRSDRPVFVDFTAEWCLTCKVNERTALRDENVVNAFTTLKVEAFRADWTNRNPEITALLAKFGRSGVPLYVVFPLRNRTAPEVLPEVVTAGIVREALERAAAR